MANFFDFMTRSVNNFTAVRTIASILEDEGFTQLLEEEPDWDVQPGSRHYVIKNDSAIFAFIAGNNPQADPFAIIAAHSDSPTFRLKPNPAISLPGPENTVLVKLNTEVYGGAIWDSWFDRPLGLSGRVVLALNPANPLELTTRIVCLEEPRLVIPRLAIHFNRDVNKGVALSAQKDTLPLLGYVDKAIAQTPVKHLLAEHLGVDPEEIIDFDLTLFDAQGPETVGADGSWVNCGRLDDLAMAWCALSALLQAEPGDVTQVMAIFDNEETGSGTRQGAHSPILRNILRRISNDSFSRFASRLARSFFISADCAHAAHPNYPEKMDPVNHPLLGGGPVVKVNANCKYMTDALTAARFKQICRLAGVPCQEFVNHSDSPGGSTLGNILTSQLDIDGVDMGIPLLAMHSARETASLADIDFTIKAFTTFFNTLKP